MIGTTLGSYRISSEIGKGGMGVVYLAEHTLLGKKAAVKVLRADMPKEYIERFFNEAKAAATLHHPGLVDVFDFGHHADGSAYIVMEFLPGESLAERLAREPRLPVGLACAIIRQCANALHIAHQEGIVHRDLKPGNIFLIPDSDSPTGLRTKVLDFGIAKLHSDRDQRSVRTASGAVIGTPRYMSPEQCKNASNVDGRSDIYSLGCILYEMLLGVAPFDYDSWAELVGAHIYEVPPKPSEIDSKFPADVETLLNKMLEKSPSDRFQSMQDLAQSLEVILATHGVERMRLTPPGGRIVATPAQGVRSLASGRDETLPAGNSGEVKAISPATVPGKRVGTDPTVSQQREAVAPPSGVHEAVVAPPATSTKRAMPWLALGIGSVLVSAGVLVLVLVLGKDRPADPETAYIVVDQRGSGSAATKVIEEPAVTIDAAVSEALPTAIDAGVATTTIKKPPPTEIDTAALTRTFNQRKGAITACFNKHPGTPPEQVSVRFQVDTKGAVKVAEVLPATVGASPLGGCIANVARATAFGPLPKPATFRVPLVSNQQ